MTLEAKSIQILVKSSIMDQVGRLSEEVWDSNRPTGTSVDPAQLILIGYDEIGNLLTRQKTAYSGNQMKEISSI